MGKNLFKDIEDAIECVLLGQEDDTFHININGSEYSYMLTGGHIGPTGKCFHDGCEEQPFRSVDVELTQLRDESGCDLPLDGEIARLVMEKLHHGKSCCKEHEPELGEMIFNARTRY